jgi:hypothetical protein
MITARKSCLKYIRKIHREWGVEDYSPYYFFKTLITNSFDIRAKGFITDYRLILQKLNIYRSLNLFLKNTLSINNACGEHIFNICFLKTLTLV